MGKVVVASSLLLSMVSLGAVAQDSFNLLFGSCAEQDEPLAILQSVVDKKPDGFVFLGDNIYGDTQDMTVLKRKYQMLADNPNFQALKAAAPLYAIWDDHDFGGNDAGAEYPQKAASKQIMLDFWQEPENSTRRTQKDGIYTSYMLGSDAKRIHLILPDLRYNRAPIKAVDSFVQKAKRALNNQGPYVPHDKPGVSMLGENQWQWLEQQLQVPAEIIVIGSSLQVLADFTGWESWANYPNDRERLFALIKKHRVNGVMLISGDTHWGEVSYYEQELDYPIWEVTSSGLSQEWKDISPNKHRIGQATGGINFGQLQVDFSLDDPLIQFGLYDGQGKTVTMHKFHLSSLSPYQ